MKFEPTQSLDVTFSINRRVAVIDGLRYVKSRIKLKSPEQLEHEKVQRRIYMKSYRLKKQTMLDTVKLERDTALGALAQISQLKEVSTDT